MKDRHVLIAYLLPKQLSIILAKTFRYEPPGPIAVFLDRETKTFEVVRVKA
jgi:hypothetical protein